MVIKLGLKYKMSENLNLEFTNNIGDEKLEDNIKDEVQDLLKSPEIEKNHKSVIFLIRHAESNMNVNSHLVGGRSNETPLSETGINQAKKLGQYLKNNDIKPDNVYVSPAVRTVQTAGFCLEELGLDITPIVDEAIQELGQGIMEGVPREEAYTQKVMDEMEKLGKDFKFEGGESMNDVAKRMHNWLSEKFSEENEDSKLNIVFVFTHGIAIKCLLSHMNEWDRETTFQTKIDNASITKLVRKTNEKGLTDWSIESINTNTQN